MGIPAFLFMLGAVLLLVGTFLPGSLHTISLVAGFVLVGISIAMGTGNSDEELPHEPSAHEH